jgi:hypothetical protein
MNPYHSNQHVMTTNTRIPCLTNDDILLTQTDDVLFRITTSTICS